MAEVEVNYYVADDPETLRWLRVGHDGTLRCALTDAVDLLPESCVVERIEVLDHET